jgi:hypothetical protein
MLKTINSTSIEEFVNSFQYKFNQPVNTDEVKLVFNLMSENHINILYTELDDYILNITQQMDDMPLPHAKYFELDGILYDTTPEYEELDDKRSKAQEILNILEICEF